MENICLLCVHSFSWEIRMKVRTNIKAGMGLGDCVAKIAHALNLDDIAKKYEHASGQSCGCKERQEILNKLVPHIPLT